MKLLTAEEMKEGPDAVARMLRTADLEAPAAVAWRRVLEMQWNVEHAAAKGPGLDDATRHYNAGREAALEDLAALWDQMAAKAR